MRRPGRFMVAIGAVLEHVGTRDVLLLRRSRDADFAPGVWEDISGRMHHGEDPETALRREIREETRIDDVEVVRPLRTWHAFRGAPEPEFELVGITHWCRTSEREVVLSDEHDAYRWLGYEEAIVLAGSEGIREGIRALTLLEGPRQLIVVAGLPGTGKTTIGEHVGRTMDAVVLSLAWVLGAIEPMEVADRGSRRELAYRMLTRLAEHQLRSGGSVVLDSMAGSVMTRDRWHRLARECAARFVVIECVCSDAALHRRRVESRRGDIPGWADPGWDHVEEMRLLYEPWTSDRLVVDSVVPLVENLKHVDAFLARSTEPFLTR